MIQNIRRFDRAFTNAGSGSGRDIREAGDQLAELADSVGSLLDYLPDELAVLKLPVQTMLRAAGSLGRVGTHVFAAYFDRINSVFWGVSQRGRSVFSGMEDPRLLASLQFHLGDRFISDISNGEESAAAQRQMAEDADELIDQLREGVEGSTFLGFQVQAPGVTCERQTEALDVINRMQGTLSSAASRLQNDLTAANQFLCLVQGTSRKFDRFEYRDSILGVLNPSVSEDINYITGHVLNYGSIAGVCSPTDVGLRL